jgi:hypothetical protein
MQDFYLKRIKLFLMMDILLGEQIMHLEIKKDGVMVHELFHVLWNKINNKDESKERNYSFWSEGFAEYGQFNYFYDFILSGSTMMSGSGKKYIKGKKLIEKVINKYSEEVFLQIPLKWKEFDKEFN